MDKTSAQEIMACLPVGKTAFNYYKDYYAVFILTQVVGKQCPIARLKQSVYAPLLNKPVIKNILAQCGDGWLRREQLQLTGSEKAEPFLLTLALWGNGKTGWTQVSRPGYSLVLQLNFSNKHDRVFRQLVNPSGNHYFSHYGHPVLQPGQREFFRETLAWSRIDVDFSVDEALIEELQTDWLRDAARRLDLIKRGTAKLYSYENGTTLDKIKTYLEYVLDGYQDLWDEALLTATLQFIWQELGIKTVYLHTLETGAAVKRIKYTKPPRSLYIGLPKRFCFRQTAEAPQFLRQTPAFRRLERALGQTRWHVINLGQTYAHNNPASSPQPGRVVTRAA